MPRAEPTSGKGEPNHRGVALFARRMQTIDVVTSRSVSHTTFIDAEASPVVSLARLCLVLVHDRTGGTLPMPRSQLLKRDFSRYFLLVGATAGVFGLGFVGASLLRLEPEVPPDSGPGGTTATAPTSPSGFLWLVYVGNPDCGWSTQPAAREAVRTIIARGQREAEARELRFVATGVVTTAEFRRAFDHLDGLGEFDEVSIGEHPTNSVTLDHFWGRGLAPSTPQIVLFEREVETTSQDSILSLFARSDVHRLARASGIAALTAWAESGRFLPPGSADLSPLTGNSLRGGGS